MTRKHFRAVASIIRNELALAQEAEEAGDPTPGPIALNNLAYVLAGYFKTENPRFDRQKFLEACGL